MKKPKKRWRERVPKSELRHEETQKKVERKGAEIRVEAMKKPKKKVERKGAEIRVEAMKKRKKKRWRERVPKSELRP